MRSFKLEVRELAMFVAARDAGLFEESAAACTQTAIAGTGALDLASIGVFGLDHLESASAANRTGGGRGGTGLGILVRHTR